MFTGLIITTGTVRKILRQEKDMRIVISPAIPFENIQAGESIAVNGACLTVERYNSESFIVYTSKETLSRTTLQHLVVGQIVNLERALCLGDRLGGHIVAGHVDCMGRIEEIHASGESTKYIIRFPTTYSRYVIEKGSIALDGISLTINKCGEGYVEVNIIPETKKNTNIFTWKEKDRVNIEFDIIGKYVEKLISPWQTKQKDQGITLDFLKEHGF